MIPAEFAADIDHALVELRAFAEARMTSRARLRRPTGHVVQDPATGAEDAVWTTTHTDLPLRLGRADSSGAVIGSVPATTGDVEPGDLLEVTAGPRAGYVAVIGELDTPDDRTALRLPLTRAARPSEWGTA